MVETFTCLNCGKVCIPKKFNWRKLYCSKKCTDKHYDKTHPEVRKLIKRKWADAHREMLVAKSKKYYWENREKYKKWGEKHRLDNNARTRAKLVAKKHFPQKICLKCGSFGNIHVHHIDFNSFNNKFSNLEYLCSICHGKEHRDKVICYH